MQQGITRRCLHNPSIAFMTKSGGCPCIRPESQITQDCRSYPSPFARLLQQLSLLSCLLVIAVLSLRLPTRERFYQLWSTSSCCLHTKRTYLYLAVKQIKPNRYNFFHSHCANCSNMPPGEPPHMTPAAGARAGAWFTSCTNTTRSAQDLDKPRCCKHQS